MWADAHCHLADSRVFNQRHSLIEAAGKDHVTKFIAGGYSPDEWDRQDVLYSELGAEHFVRSFGMHPWWIVSVLRTNAGKQVFEAAWAELERRVLDPKRAPSAIGETGLDFYSKIPVESHSVQKEYFSRHLDLASRTGLPLVLHVVSAHDEVLVELARWRASWVGMVHAFSENFLISKRYIDLGLKISIGTAVLFSNRHELHETVRNLSLDNLVIESDTPDQPPQGGQRGTNRPSVILQIADRVAELKGITREAVLNASTATLKKVFL